MVAGFWGWKPWRRGGGRGWGWRGWGPGWQGPVPPQPVQVQLPEGGVPLSELPAGSKAKVLAVLAGQGATMRAYQMGIAPGVIVEVVENNRMYPWTPVLVRVQGMTVALGRGLASRIIVKPLTPQASGGGGPGGGIPEA